MPGVMFEGTRFWCVFMIVVHSEGVRRCWIMWREMVGEVRGRGRGVRVGEGISDIIDLDLVIILCRKCLVANEVALD